MMECEICGKSGYCTEIDFEGNLVFACRECSALGRKKEFLRGQGKSPAANPGAGGKSAEKALSPGFGLKIRRAREAKGLTVKELAEKIFEKESFLHKVENGLHIPDDALARKLEKFLGVSITEGAE